MKGYSLVIDIGKTVSKLSLWSPQGDRVEQWTRHNVPQQGPGYRSLDTSGIETWLEGRLRHVATRVPIDAVVPVGHGAAAALVCQGTLLCPPMDYEQPLATDLRRDYDQQRDAFDLTGSPALPDGLNLAAQLHLLEALGALQPTPGTRLITWPQYWAWRLCGVAATEVSSLGCHTDLWSPANAQPSPLAVRRRWAELLAPIRRADECLGTLSAEWAARTGLSRDVRIYCGLHDSNAALIAARASPQLADTDVTVLSTGTWFVAMRVPAAGSTATPLPSGRDCLMNVDPYGHPVPSARFMGGREIETLTGTHSQRIDTLAEQEDMLAALVDVLDQGVAVIPGFAPGCGPFPHARGSWQSRPAAPVLQRAAVALYAALMADVCLDLIGSHGQLVVEGRFARSQILVRALATLRPNTQVYVGDGDTDVDVASGALRLIDPNLPVPVRLARVLPLSLSLAAYRDAWRSAAERQEHST